MKQLRRAKAEQRNIKWLFEVFSASLRCLVHLLAQLLRQHVLFLRVWVKKDTTKEKNGFWKWNTGYVVFGGIKRNKPNKVTIDWIVSYFYKCDVLKLSEDSFEAKQTPRSDAKC